MLEIIITLTTLTPGTFRGCLVGIHRFRHNVFYDCFLYQQLGICRNGVCGCVLFPLLVSSGLDIGKFYVRMGLGERPML